MKKYCTLLLILISAIAPNLADAKTICVDTNAKSSGKGTCWHKPYLTLQEALDSAEQDKTIEEIWIAKGIYKPTKTYSPKDKHDRAVIAGAMSLKEYNPGITMDQTLIHYADNAEQFNRYLKTFQLINNVSLYGGFQGQSGPGNGEKYKNERFSDLQSDQTILDGQLDGYQVWHVITAGNDITLKGVKAHLDRIVVRNGNAISAPYYPIHFPLKPNEVPIYYHDDAGGLYIFARSEITLNQMVFENNAGIAGGAIYVEDGSKLEINDSTFKNNLAAEGGAINMRSGGPNEFLNHPESRITKVTITNSEFINNASFYGSAIIINDTQLNPSIKVSEQNIHLNNCRFTDNPTLNTKVSISSLSKIYADMSQLEKGQV